MWKWRKMYRTCGAQPRILGFVARRLRSGLTYAAPYGAGLTKWPFVMPYALADAPADRMNLLNFVRSPAFPLLAHDRAGQRNRR